MDDATQILVIITSSVLVLFLLIAIVLAIRVLQLVNAVRRLVQKAGNMAEAAKAASESMQKSLVGTALLRSALQFLQKQAKQTKRK